VQKELGGRKKTKKNEGYTQGKRESRKKQVLRWTPYGKRKKNENPCIFLLKDYKGNSGWEGKEEPNW